jgi:glucose/arabinose dehydrogenase
MGFLRDPEGPPTGKSAAPHGYPPEEPAFMGTTMPEKSKTHLFAAGVFALASVSSHAAPVTWGTVQTITGASDIVSTGVTNLAGADFGAPAGTTTTVNNGSVDIAFKTVNSGQGALLSNGITVAAESTWGNFGNATGNSNLTGNFGVVLDRNLGIEDGNPPDADITLSGLNPGTQYQVQFFTSDLRAATNALTQTIEGASGAVSGTMTPDNGASGTSVIGTFTADTASQILTVRGTGSANVALANALAIGELGASVVPPVANNDAITMNPGGAAGLTVLLNDTGGTLDPLGIMVTTGPSAGSTAVPQADGRILYSHGGAAGATDSFTYTVRNQTGTTSNEATVTITIDSSLRLENTTSTLPDTAPPVTLAVVDAFPGLLFEDVLALRSPPGSTTQLFLAERRGKITYIPDVTSATPERRVLIDLGTIPGFAFDDTSEGELGLLSFAFHPDFANNGYFYVFYTATGGNPYFNRLSRFQIALDGGGTPILDNPTASIATELQLFSEFDQVDNHNAGDIHFGPDGYLYIAMGDEGNQKNASRNAQLIDKDLYSAVLRIDVDKRPGNIEPNLDDAIPTDGGIARFSIPIDNPFVHTSFGGGWDGTFNGSAIPDLAKVQRSFWAVGFRSPWRMSFDSLTGDLYLGDVGQENYEEVSVVERGKNYGWAFREGFQQTPGTPSANIGVPPPGFAAADPLYDYSHGSGNFQGNSVTGGVVYRGVDIPSMTGKYIFGDFVSGHIWSLDRSTGAPVVERLATDAGIAAFGTDPSNGDVLLCDYLENKVKRLVAGMTLAEDFPQTLTETGIFADLATMTPNPGILAYEPAVSFWSDHAIKKRWFSIPDLAGKIGFSTDTPWTLPQGMFWVKHFDIEIVRGDPATSKRIETRILMKTATGSYGVSYKWNAGGTEATLVEDAGETINLAILDGGTPINQTYQIPSRGACFSCHTPVAGHALSFNTRQLHRDDLIAGILGNQIGTLDSAGYFDAPLPSLASTPTFAPVSDTRVSREFRVRSYLAVNCVSCHQPGGSAPGTWDARPNVSLEQTGLILGSAARPLNPGDLLVAAGDSTHSILLQRVKAGNGYTRMPPLGSHVLDSGAIQLIQDWIQLDLPGYQTYDQWAAGWFGPGAGVIAERGTDADGDGRDNEFERLTGTNPRIGGDSWTMDLTVTGDNVLLDFPVPANAAILIESSPDLRHWIPWPVPGNEPFFPAAAGTRQLTAPVSQTGPSHFFRGTAIEP